VITIPPQSRRAKLSETALFLLRSCRGEIVTDDSNRDACREQSFAGMLLVLGVGRFFSRGRDMSVSTG
jgi:hypothetical protein